MKTPLVIKLFYLQRFFIHFIFFWSVDKIFFSQRGASTFEISLLVGLWGAFALIFEVPSGVIADRWSRKKMIVLAAFAHSTAYLTWIFSHNFLGFLIGYLLRGLGGVLESGTVDAFFYDHLKALKQEENYEWGK
jgi:MFS family permease